MHNTICSRSLVTSIVIEESPIVLKWTVVNSLNHTISRQFTQNMTVTNRGSKVKKQLSCTVFSAWRCDWISWNGTGRGHFIHLNVQNFTNAGSGDIKYLHTLFAPCSPPSPACRSGNLKMPHHTKDVIFINVKMLCLPWCTSRKEASKQANERMNEATKKQKKQTNKQTTKSSYRLEFVTQQGRSMSAPRRVKPTKSPQRWTPNLRPGMAWLIAYWW